MRVNRRVPQTVRASIVALLALLLLAGMGPSAASAEELSSTGGIATEKPAYRDSIVRLYGAVFDRAPDQSGLDYWVERYVGGTSLSSIATSFMVSPEWTDTYGEVDDARFVNLLYNNVLDRDPDADGREYWTGRLGAGASREALLLGFSESDENVDRTNTVKPETPPPPAPAVPSPPAGSGSGRRIVYSNSAQRVWLIDGNENIVDYYAVSGKRGVPSPGQYRVFSKSTLAYAGHDGITMKHMVRFAWGSELAIGFHAIPRYADGSRLQSDAALGSYRSAGCVRQSDHKAQALYNWAGIGTRVVVLG